MSQLTLWLLPNLVFAATHPVQCWRYYTCIAGISFHPCRHQQHYLYTHRWDRIVCSGVKKTRQDSRILHFLKQHWPFVSCHSYLASCFHHKSLPGAPSGLPHPTGAPLYLELQPFQWYTGWFQRSNLVDLSNDLSYLTCPLVENGQMKPRFQRPAQKRDSELNNCHSTRWIKAENPQL